MRIRSGWAIPVALVAGMALPLTAIQTANSAPPSPRVGVAQWKSVMLPTGDLARLRGRSGAEQVVLAPAASSGIRRALVTYRFHSRTYVVPVDAEPYLGRFLDPSLFDVTGLAALTDETARVPVRMSYRGSSPAVPGVTITSAANGIARGYLTRSSAVTFGKALTAQYQADLKAGRPARTSLFTGVTKLSAEVAPVSLPVTPKYPMVTLTLKAVGADGKADPYATLVLMNSENSLKYASFVFPDAKGEAKVSVPLGHYTLIGDDGGTAGAAEGTYLVRMALKTDYHVTRTGQTLTNDFRTATVGPVASVPKATTLESHTFAFDFRDAAKNDVFGSALSFDPKGTLLLPPGPTATVGTLRTLLSWQLVQPGASPSYSYDVAASSNRVPATSSYTFTAAQMATVKAAYYGDGPAADAGILHYPFTPAIQSEPGLIRKVARGSRMTEYLGSTGAVAWGDLGVFNFYSQTEDITQFDDFGWVDGPIRVLPAGSSHSVNWFRGPLAPSIPIQPTAASGNQNQCYACRSGNTISLGLTGFTDSDPSHAGELNASNNGLSVSRFQVYRNGKETSDQDNTMGATFSAPAAKASYKIVANGDRQEQSPTQSTRTSTVLTFNSAKSSGKKLPANWACDAGSNCRVLPILTARLALPTDLNGSLPVGKSTVTLTLAQAQNATASPITSATLEYRPSGYYLHHPIALTSIGGGKYRGVIDNPDRPGVKIDLFITGKDKAGSTITQTIANAYTIKGS